MADLPGPYGSVLQGTRTLARGPTLLQGKTRTNSPTEVASRDVYAEHRAQREQRSRGIGPRFWPAEGLRRWSKQRARPNQPMPRERRVVLEHHRPARPRWSEPRRRM